MAFVIVPEMIRASYDLLCATPPFDRWNLPDSDEIIFKVNKTSALYAWQTFDGDRHTIGVSTARVGSVDVLNRCVAHEMIHVHEANVRLDRNDIEHSAAWKKWADQVCSIHGFDRKAF